MILTGATGIQGVDLPVSSLNLLRKQKLQMQQELDTMENNSTMTPVEQERQRQLQLDLFQIEEQIIVERAGKHMTILEEPEEAVPERDASRNSTGQAVAGTAAALQQMRAETSGVRRDQPQDLQAAVPQLEAMAEGPPIARGEPRTGGGFENSGGEKGGSGSGYAPDEKRQGRNFDKTV